MNQTGGTKKPDFIVPVFGMHMGSVQFLGTAFFVDQNTLLTANHVATTKDARTKPREELKIKVGNVEAAGIDDEVLKHATVYTSRCVVDVDGRENCNRNQFID